MTPRERIVRLEGLLDRVTKNATRPRAPRALATPSAAPVVAALPEPVVEATPAPAPVAPSPSPVEAAPPPPSAAPAPPPLAEVAQQSSSVPPWKPEPGSTVQARPSSMPPEELSEDDLIDVTTVPPPQPAAAAASEAAQGEEVEEPPASSSRSKVAESLDQAIASAAAQADDGEVPIHTPPPESGPQEAVLPAGIEAPRAPDIADLEPALERAASLGPTPEQLGATIELQGSETPDIEIEVGGLPEPEPAMERPPEELEVTLPRAEMPSGTYDLGEAEPAPVISAAEVGVPEITLRPAIEAAEITHVVRVSEKAPEHFSELLDATLAL